MLRALLFRLLAPHPVAALLEQARQQLPTPPAPQQLLPDSARSYQTARASYEELLAQQEWELALEGLAELGAALAPVPPRFWELLEEVAGRLQLPSAGAGWQQWRPVPSN